MNCERTKERLPLYAGGDLQGVDANEVRVHLQRCGDCQGFLDGLTDNQQLLRSFRQQTVAPAALNAMRQELFPRLAETKLGWWIRFERFLIAGARRPRLAVAGAAIAVIVSASLFAQLRQVTASPDKTAAVFHDGGLVLPEDYKDWVFVGRATEPPHAQSDSASRNVYMSPAAFRDYRRNGVFPEGTVMILESKAENNAAVTLEASVKSRHFSEGWGYFRFDSAGGGLAKKAQALTDSEGCIACHKKGARDHVFTQFYPALKANSGVQI